MSSVDISMILQAERTLNGVIKHTELLFAEKLSKRLEGNIYLKLENLQKSGSFKIRGAYNRIIHLSPEEKACGVVASSAGNHAQGVAISATQLGIKSTIVMPKTAPFAKVNATRNYGGEVVLHGDIYDDAFNKACQIQEETGATFIHPFNDPLVIAGQGTIGLEILNDKSDIDTVLVPIGGGGICSGIAVAVKSINPNVRVIGVQAANANAMELALKNGKVEQIKVTKTIADGTAVAKPGDLTFEIIQKYVDEIITVTEDEIAQAYLYLLETCNISTEGSGALVVAAMMAGKVEVKGRNVAGVVSGGNIDVTLIESVINHALMSLGRRTEIKTEILDKPGHLANLVRIISEDNANIDHIHQGKSREGLFIHDQAVTIVMETIDAAHKMQIINRLIEAGYSLRYTKSIHDTE
jgi:threonine dehydratase